MVDKITRYTADLIDWDGPGEQNREPATDIRERLRMMARRKSPSVLAAQLDEAADEIERLRERVEMVMSINHQQGDEIERLLVENKKLWEGLDAMVNPKPDGNANMSVLVPRK